MSGIALRLLASALVAIVLIPCQNAGAQDPDVVTGGQYLATAANCVTCHTRPGGEPFAGGVSFETRFGTIYSTNITPDHETGIGRWSNADFRRALREGIGANGEHLYPAFPYTAFTNLTDADIDAMFAYLRTVAAVRYEPPENNLTFPFNLRSLLSVWKTLYFDGERHVVDTARSTEWNRGAYLIEALGHCGACHTPRNFLGAERVDEWLSGGTYLDRIPGGQVRNWSAVNLTPAKSGLAAWSVDELAAYLKTGLNSYATTFGPMNKVIMQSTRHLSDADVRAMAVYLKSLAPVEPSSDSRPDDDVMTAGSELYAVHCGTCHLPTGNGAIDTGPALAGNPVVQAADPASLINSILYGPELPDPAPPVQRMHMEPYADRLSDEEIATLATFLRSSWGNRGGTVSPKDVARQR